jgi:hypothetical protein
MLGWKFGSSNLPAEPVPDGIPRLQSEAYLEGHRDGTKAYQAAQQRALNFSDEMIS